MIDTIQVWGERNSGTNYLSTLLAANLTDVRLTNFRENFGWKHGDIGQVVKPRNEIVEPRILHPSSSSLFIVMYRNPFDWLGAMHRLPHQNPLAHRIGMSQFLRQPWESYNGNIGQDISNYHLERMASVKPEDLFEYYESVLDLRQKKIEMFESFKKRVENVAYVNLEILQHSPELVINQLAKAFDMGIKEEFEDILTEKHTDSQYQRKQYAPMTTQDVRLVVAQNNWRYEAKIGYVLDPIKTFFDLNLKPGVKPLSRDLTFVKNPAHLTVLRQRIRVKRGSKSEVIEL